MFSENYILIVIICEFVEGSIRIAIESERKVTITRLIKGDLSSLRDEGIAQETMAIKLTLDIHLENALTGYFRARYWSRCIIGHHIRINDARLSFLLVQGLKQTWQRNNFVKEPFQISTSDNTFVMNQMKWQAIKINFF